MPLKKDPLGCKPTPSLSAPELAWGWSCLVLLGGRPLSHRDAIAYAKRHGRRAGLASIALAVTASKPCVAQSHSCGLRGLLHFLAASSSRCSSYDLKPAVQSPVDCSEGTERSCCRAGSSTLQAARYTRTESPSPQLILAPSPSLLLSKHVPVRSGLEAAPANTSPVSREET